MKNIVVLGSSGHAKVIIDIIEKEEKYKIVGLLDRFRKVGEETLGFKVIGKEEDLRRLISEFKIQGGIVAVGDNFIRHKVVENILAVCPKFIFFTTVHPKAYVANNVSIAEGSVVMAGVIINSSSSIGRFCILNTNSSLDHDSVLEDFSSLAPGATIGGNVQIGAFSAISIGATIIHGIEIGEHTVIGAGATVLNPMGAYKVAFGTPAKEIRERKPGDKYL